MKLTDLLLAAVGRNWLWGNSQEKELVVHPVPPLNFVFRPEIIDFSDKSKLPWSISTLSKLFGKGRESQIPLEITYLDRYTLKEVSFRGIATACDLIPFSGMKENYTLTNFIFKQHGDKSFIAGQNGIPVSPCIGNLTKVRIFSDSRFNDKELLLAKTPFKPINFAEERMVDFRGCLAFPEKAFKQFVGDRVAVIFRPYKTLTVRGFNEHSYPVPEQVEASPITSKSPEESAFSQITGVILDAESIVRGRGVEKYNIVRLCFFRDLQSKEETFTFSTGKFSNTTTGTSQLIAIGKIE